MKFIIRNLGWILLIIFFVFMLYLISNQNNLENNTKTNTGTAVQNLVNTDSKENISEEIAINNEKEENSTGGILSSIKSFFSFSSSDKLEEEKNNDNKLETLTGEVDEELIQKVDKIITKNLKKQEKENKIIQEEKNNLANDLAGDKVKEVAVKSIFLNNAYFTKRLYTAYKGDKLEQLTPTNKYGCFKVKVISSKDIRNNGKIAWTCEYYMKGKTDTIKKYIPAAIEYNKKIKKNISRIYKVNVTALKLNNYNFTKKLGIVYGGDKLRQLTPANSYGCFQIEVLNSKNRLNNGKIAWACKKYLK